MATELVAPGERIATEEEFAAGQNTYADSGIIYASTFGSVSKGDGKISVVSATGREVRMIDKGMMVIGTVTDDMRSVIFVELSDINVGRKEYLALKDGKILPEKEGPMRPMGGRGRDNKFYESREKLVGIGDTILAKVLFNDKDSYMLGLHGEEFGVVYAKCGSCGGDMGLDEQRGQLVCNDCGFRERRKISVFYGRPEKIKALFA